MMILRNDHTTLAKVIEAKSFLQRSRGLMFRKDWNSETTMWIHRCNSIHTCFMHFPIDVVFVNRKLIVKKIILNIKPWKMTLPVLSASSVFEFKSGENKISHINVGDQLYVGH